MKELLRLDIAGEQLVRIAVVRAAKRAYSNLDRLNAKACEIVERLLQGHRSKDDCEYTELHGWDSP
jgi:hypothetical protein